MKNEVIKTLEHYFRNESNTVQYLGSAEGVNLFAELLESGTMIPGDAPDAVLIKDNLALIIEHFEFDGFEVNRKGSKSRMEQARIDREQREISATEAGVVYHSKIKALCSYQDYIDNVTRSFLDHYQRIATYKKNILERGIITSETDVKTMFLIEDVSPIGSIAIDKSGDKVQTIPVILAQSPEFLNLLTDSENLDYVLCCSYACDSEYVWFIDRSHIPSYKEKQCSYASMKFLSNYPSVVYTGIHADEMRVRSDAEKQLRIVERTLHE